MADKLRLKLLLLISFFALPVANAGIYIGLAPTLIQVKTNAGSTSPWMADLRLGYAQDVHKLELALMSSIRDDNLNQLVTDIPIATSLLYRFTTNPKDSLHMEVILGYSLIDVKSSYVQVPTFTSRFHGVSYGLGFEEALNSLPQLKFRIDLMQLYRGDNLKLNSFTMGFRYEF